MTTYVLEGFGIIRANLSFGDDEVAATPATLQIVVEDNVTELTYSVVNQGPYDHDNLPEVNFGIPTLGSFVNGIPIEGGNSVLATEPFLFDVVWSQNGVPKRTTIFLVEAANFSPTVIGFELPNVFSISVDYIFTVAGDPFPPVNDPSDFDNLTAQITGFEVASSPFGPGDVIQLANFADSVTEDDILTGTDLQDTYNTGVGADAIIALGGNDTINSGSGNDLVLGGSGADEISAGEGADTVDGGDGPDLVFLNQGNDLYLDNSQGAPNGNDTVFTGLGDDTVEGGNGNDVFYGEDGNDVINGRLGNDLIFGGNNFDTISAGKGNDTVFGGNGRDLVFLNQGNDLFNDNAQGGELGRDTVFTGLGDDTVEGGNGNDVFYGEDGNDVINGRLGNDLIFGGNNFDTISAGEGDDTVEGGNGRDLVFLNQGNDLFNDNAQGGDLGRDTVFGGLGNDTIEGGNGSDQFFGEDGNDLINARLGDDTVGGGAGNDTINGGGGSDTLTGSVGIDTFIFDVADASSGTDLVTDFQLGTDVFRLVGTNQFGITINYNSNANEVLIIAGFDDVTVLRSSGDLSGFGFNDIGFV